MIHPIKEFRKKNYWLLFFAALVTLWSFLLLREFTLIKFTLGNLNTISIVHAEDGGGGDGGAGVGGDGDGGAGVGGDGDGGAGIGGSDASGAGIGGTGESGAGIGGAGQAGVGIGGTGETGVGIGGSGESGIGVGGTGAAAAVPAPGSETPPSAAPAPAPTPGPAPAPAPGPGPAPAPGPGPAPSPSPAPPPGPGSGAPVLCLTQGALNFGGVEPCVFPGGGGGGGGGGSVPNVYLSRNITPSSFIFLSQVPFTGIGDNVNTIGFILTLLIGSGIGAYQIILAKEKSAVLGTHAISSSFFPRLRLKNKKVPENPAAFSHATYLATLEIPPNTELANVLLRKVESLETLPSPGNPTSLLQNEATYQSLSTIH